MEAKKNLLTYAGLKKLEDELPDLKVVKRKEVAEKIKEAREQGDLSENAANRSLPGSLQLLLRRSEAVWSDPVLLLHLLQKMQRRSER